MKTIQLILVLLVLLPTLASALLRGHDDRHHAGAGGTEDDAHHDTATAGRMLAGGMTSTTASSGMGGGGGMGMGGGDTTQQMMQVQSSSGPTTAAPATVSPVSGPPTTTNRNETVPTPPIDIGPTSPVIPPTASPYTCPSPVSPAYQNQPPGTIPVVRACSVDRDCIGFVSKDSPDGTTCCVHPFCVCGVTNPTVGSTRCVGTATAPAPIAAPVAAPVALPTTTTTQSPINRVDPVPSPPIDIGPVVPSPTRSPVSPTQPTPASCPTDIAPFYQVVTPGATPVIVPCKITAECVAAGFTSKDGPTCCLYPRCVCSVVSTSSGNQCV